MKSIEIQESIAHWARHNNFNAPYGVLTGEHMNKKGRKYLSVTFGRPRTLDCTVDIYNKNFMVVTSSRHGSRAFTSVEELKEFLDQI
jgi:hypothetical protein